MDFYVWIKYKTQLPLCFGEHNLCGWRQAAVFVMKCNMLNMQQSFVLLTSSKIYCIDLWTTGFTCLFGVIDKFTFRYTAYQIAVSLMKWQLILPFVLSLAMDVLFP
jgi:hypothetical protein